MDYTTRLGDVMSEENLMQVNMGVNEAKLPTIPYDPSIHEIQILLTYHGNRLAYLMANNELVANQIKEKKVSVDRAFNLAYKAAMDRKEGMTATAAKVIASQNANYIKEQDEMLALMRTQALLSGEIAALQEQNVCLRKVASLQALAIERGIA